MAYFSLRSTVVIFPLAALVFLTSLSGCGPSDSPSAGASVGSTAPSAAAVAGLSDPCHLLTDAQVREVIPEAKAGEPYRASEEAGMRTCQWGEGRLVLQLYAAKSGDAAAEAKGWTSAFLSPFDQNAGKLVRYETIAGVGEQAVAVVENRDEKRGILSDAAYIMVRRGNQWLFLHAEELARGDRTQALQSLTALARLAIARM